MTGNRRAASVLPLLVLTGLTAQDPSPSIVFTERAARAAAAASAPQWPAIRTGIAWLVAHQEVDGHWDPAGFGRHDPAADRCLGAGAEVHTVGITALALLAVLAAADPAHLEACHKAADWLANQVDEATGHVHGEHPDCIYDHAIATTALAEASALLGRPRHREAATAAIACLLAHRNEGAAWRYAPKDGDNDSSVTAWCLAALAAGRHLGLDVPAAAVGEALAWLDSTTDAITGECGYQRRGDPSARLSIAHGERFPVSAGAALTPASLHARLASGLAPDDRMVQGAVDYLLQRPPEWGTNSVDYVTWLHASVAVANVPGAHPARRYEAKLHEVLVANQRRGGSAGGSWDPIDVWGDIGGRVYATACAVVCLNSPWRLGRMDAMAWIPATPPFQPVRAAWQQGRLGGAATELARITGDHATMARARWIRWYLDVEVARALRHQVVLSRLLPAASDQEDYLERAVKTLTPLPVAEQAARMLVVLRADPAARTEIEAGRMLRPARKLFDEAMAQQDPKKRAAARQQLTALVKKYPDTPSAQTAIRLLEQIGGN